ncbi:hypothetical protein KAR91_27765, partial [Candidatus Pacearchaeota archaeon]|nr:hypothetical protein [Candidatus Pacearchaeota archaeon]
MTDREQLPFQAPAALPNEDSAEQGILAIEWDFWKNGIKLQSNDDTISVQNPLPVDGDSVYEKDIDLENSSSENFVTGDVTDFFNDLQTTLVNDTGDNPKTIIIYFNRAISAAGLAIGDVNGGSHSGVKIEALRGGNIYTTLRDNSASVIPFNSRFYSFSTTAGNDEIGIVSFTALRITFHTASTVSISNSIINKIQDMQSALIALKPDGITTYIGATRYSNLKVAVQEYGDTPSIDAFDRLRTSEPFTIFDSKQLHDKQPLFWDEEIGGAATSIHNTVNAETRMSVTASVNDYVIRQTKQRFNYQPGKSQLIFMTFHSPQADGATKRIGSFDGIGANFLTPNNGVFYECDGDLSWNICKDGTITERVTQSQWNVDKLDGSGKSGIALDMDGSQIIIMDLEWLGVGRVRVGFVIDGLIYYVHYFNHSNKPAFTSVYMSTPNLPLRYTIETDGAEATHLDHICSTVMSEGGVEKTGILRAIDTKAVPINLATAGVAYAVLGIRLKTSYIDISVMPEGISAIIGSNADFYWSVQINPTRTGGVFVYNDLMNSAVQGAIATTPPVITADGLVIASGYGSKSSRQADTVLNTALRIGATIAGVRDELVLSFIPLSTNINVYPSLNFRE